MTTFRFAALALLLSAGCAGVTARPGPPVPSTSTPEGDPVPQLPAEQLREGIRPEGVQGVYRLVRAGGATLPAAVETRGGCELRAVQGTLSLQEGGFTFSGTTQEVCGGTVRPPAVHRAEGRYERDGAAVRFTAGAGTAFGSASAQILEAGVLQVTGVTAGGRTRAVSLEFRKEDPPRR